MIKIIVGLGNPGAKYETTRHNIGFMVLDKLADKFNVELKPKFDGLLGFFDKNGDRIYLIKPQTFMNLSGQSVALLANFYKISAQEILVVHDEMNIDFGSLKLRHGGSAGGHNGLKSIIECLGTDKFPRLKMGIGRKQGMGDVSSYVLGKFNPQEFEKLDEFVEKGVRAVDSVIELGINKAMTDFNRTPIE